MSGADAIVVGAGPVGMAAALALRMRGRSVQVIEAGGPDRVRPGSRAIFIHGATLEVLERIQPGLGMRLAEHGLVWRTKRTFYRGREVYSRTYPPPPVGVLPAATNLPQIETERVLFAACQEAGVQFVWNAPVVGAEVRADGVDVRMGSGATASAPYVIGCDGARSAIRDATGAKLEGPMTTNAYVIVDAAEDPANPTPPERIFHYEHPNVDGRNVLFVPFEGHWRLDLQCHATDDPQAFSEEKGAKTWIPKVFRADYADRITWVSTYIFRQAVCSSFIDPARRLLLAGEAAHVFAPFGARGLNSGIPDAFVAVAAIDRALAASRADAAAAIEQFDRTRRAAALRNREASNTALRHLIPQNAFARAKRRIAGALAPHVGRVAKWLDQKPYGPTLGPPDADGMRY